MQETLGLSLDLVKPLPQLLQAALQEDAPISHTQCVFQLICHVQSADRQKAYRYACVCQVETTCNAYVMHLAFGTWPASKQRVYRCSCVPAHKVFMDAKMLGTTG